MSASNQRENDLAIVAELANYSSEKVAELVSKAVENGYTGQELGILVDVLNDEFPGRAISVFDEDDTGHGTAESILLLESWCDGTIAMGAQKRM